MDPHEEYDKRSTQTHWAAPEIIKMENVTHKASSLSLDKILVPNMEFRNHQYPTF